MRLRTALISALLLTLALPVAAYTVYLKDGSKIVTKERYRVQGAQAILTLPNGTQTFIPLNSIDVPRTEKENKDDIGTALVIEGGQARQARPGEISSDRDRQKDKRLADLIDERAVSTRKLPEARRVTAEQTKTQGSVGSTGPDLMGHSRRPYPQAQIAAQIEALLDAAGVAGASVYQGTASGRPFIELPATSEAEVMLGIKAGAEALLKTQASFPGQVSAFELLMVTPNDERAGQFLMTPDHATELVNKRVSATAYFMEHVQF